MKKLCITFWYKAVPISIEASYMLIYTAHIDQLLHYLGTDEMAYEQIFLPKDQFLSQ